MSDRKEYIICSAIYINDGKEHGDQPRNIDVGFVIAGRRHNNCYGTLLALLDGDRKSFDDFINKYVTVETEEKHQGFITSMNNYVNRKEAFIIAKENNQLLNPKLYDTKEKNILTSECIFPMDWENFDY